MGDRVVPRAQDRLAPGRPVAQLAAVASVDGLLTQNGIRYRLLGGWAVDFNAGTIKRAPLWMQRYGLEWMHRLAQEPRRLWRRYFLGNSRFFLLVAGDVLHDPRRYLRRPA